MANCFDCENYSYGTDSKNHCKYKHIENGDICKHFEEKKPLDCILSISDEIWNMACNNLENGKIHI